MDNKKINKGIIIIFLFSILSCGNKKEVDSIKYLDLNFKNNLDQILIDYDLDKMSQTIPCKTTINKKTYKFNLFNPKINNIIINWHVEVLLNSSNEYLVNSTIVKNKEDYKRILYNSFKQYENRNNKLYVLIAYDDNTSIKIRNDFLEPIFEYLHAKKNKDVLEKIIFLPIIDYKPLPHPLIPQLPED
jgi:hypothetical protein